jgi:hypothetical protein
LNPESSETPSASKKPRKFQTFWELRGEQTIASTLTASMQASGGPFLPPRPWAWHAHTRDAQAVDCPKRANTSFTYVGSDADS